MSCSVAWYIRKCSWTGICSLIYLVFIRTYFYKNLGGGGIHLSMLFICFCMYRGIQLWFYTAYITERIKLPTFIYLLFRLFTTQAFIRGKDYISEFPYILTTLYEFYMNVDMQVICCTVTTVLSGTVAGGKK